MRHFMTGALTRAGHVVEACENGLAALETLAHSRDFDLLLADIVMPGMDGIELAKKASFLLPSLKVMFITGFAGVAMSAQAQEGTQADIMSKPFHLKDLVDHVGHLLEKT